MQPGFLAKTSLLCCVSWLAVQRHLVFSILSVHLVIIVLVIIIVFVVVVVPTLSVVVVARHRLVARPAHLHLPIVVQVLVVL